MSRKVRWLIVLAVLVGAALIGMAVPQVTRAETCVKVWEPTAGYHCRDAKFTVGTPEYMAWQAETRATATRARLALDPPVDPFTRWPWRGQKPVIIQPAPVFPDWLLD